jgi:hypothetical protein
MSRQYTPSVRLNLDALEDRSLPSAGPAAGVLGDAQPGLVRLDAPQAVPPAGLDATPGQLAASSSPTGRPIYLRAGQLYRGVEVSVFRYTPLIPPGYFRPLINWGDGTPVSAGGVWLDSAGVYHVYGDHLYAQPRNYTIHVVVPDPRGGAPFQDWTLAVVSPRALGQDVRVPQGNGSVGTGVGMTAQDAYFATLVNAGTAQVVLRGADGSASTAAHQQADSDALLAGT